MQDQGNTSHLASPSDGSTRLDQLLSTAAILAGNRDQEFNVPKAAQKVKLGKGASQDDQSPRLSETLAARLRHCKASNSWLDGASEQQLQQQTGDLALELLVSIHTALLARSQDPSIQVATETTRVRDPSGSMRSVQAKEQVGLGNRDIKLARTIQSLASRWALVPRLLHYDRTLAALVPATFAKRAPSRGQQPLDSSNRFQEIVEDDPATRQHRQLEYHNARESLFRVLQRWVSIVQAGPSAQTLSASTDIAALFLQIGVVDFLAAMLRLAFGPGPGQPSTKGSSRDEVYQVASSRVSLLLNFLSTGSAISTISSVLSSSSSNKDLGLPVFVKSVASRLLSAQLLRPDGVRALLLVTLGTADSDRDAVDDDDDDDATGSTGVTGAKNVLQRYEHLARLLGTPPAGMPTEAYMSLIVPRLVDILDPDPDTTITAPAPSHMRAAAFTLTRVSERNADMLYKELDTRVYSRFNPASGKGVPAKQLTRALSLLSAFLLFAEPSPTFFDRLLSPLVPQLLSLRCFVLGAASGGKKKVRQMRKDDEIDTVANQVDQLLRAWTRLVDAQDGSKTLMLAIQRAQRGIGEDPALSPPSDNDDTLGLYWSMEEDGVCIKYGVRPQDSISVSKQLGTLSLTDLAQAISGAGNDESKPLQLASSLGLQPDPKVVAALLKTCQRKDMAKLVLPRILDAYMVQKKSKRAALPGEQSETQLVLYLHLILLLFESFDAELLEGEVGTTLTFINFCLASPTQRRQESQREDEMPFIRAHKPGGTSSSLFDIGAKMREEQDETNEQQVDLDQDEDEDEDEDAEGDEELVTTALTLLLSLLEGNRELSTETRPLLVVIASKLERHLDSVHEEVRALAKEARMVLTARREATRGPSVSASTPVSAPLGFAQAHETYQEALRLLQDPILPVRAHGLVLLRKLVSDDPRDGGQRELLDPALVPAIRDILIQAVQDEESYLYLNAVQGLSALAASGGRQTIAALVSTYLGSERDSLASSQISQRQVDMRLRVGEALLQVVQRCGDALGPNVDILVPPLLAKLRDRSVPTVLRSSMLAILGTTIEAAPVALASGSLAREMAELCLDLVSIELVPRAPLRRTGVRGTVSGSRGTSVLPEQDQDEAEAEQVPESATSTDSKLAPLRRGALLLLAHLVRGSKHQLLDAREEDGEPQIRIPGMTHRQTRTRPAPRLLFPRDLVARLGRVCGYVAAQDTDALVRVQARDCIAEADEMERVV